MKSLGLYNQYEGRVYAKEGKDISIVKRRERGDVRVHQ